MSKLLLMQGGTETEIVFSPPIPLKTLLAQSGVAFVLPCGGRGACGKCAVEASGALSEPDAQTGTYLLCRTAALGDCRVKLPDYADMSIDAGTQTTRLRPNDSARGYGAALDIGTTTLAMRVFDLRSGACVGEATRINPQTQVAADVIGRIEAAINGHGDALKSMLWDAVGQMAEQAAPGKPIYRMVAAGNTTMLYLLNGFDPSDLSRAPFSAKHLFGTHGRMADTDLYFPPCFHAFAGADLTCAILASGMCEKTRCSVLCDVGTNGEIALYRDGTLVTASAAAGPALEGAGISCGCASVPGAIDRVWREKNEVRFHTIGGQKPIGICGSGLIDLIAVLLNLGMIDETGRMERAYPLADGVALLPQDVRAIQLAKAAICAGIHTVLKKTGTDASDVQAFYAAGGFGSRIDPVSAARIGLFPRALANRTVPIGNAALDGAGTVLSDPDGERALMHLREIGTYLSLSGDADFAEFYMEDMLFA